MSNEQTANARNEGDIDNSPSDLQARQLRLEEEMLAIGIEAYDAQRARLGEVDSAPGRHLIRNALPALVEAIRQQAATTFTGRGGRQHPCTKFAYGVDNWYLSPETVAVLTLRTALQTLDDEEEYGLTSRAHDLGELIREARQWESASPVHAETEASDELDWSTQQLIALGAWLLELAAVTTGLFELPGRQMEGQEGYKKQKVLRARTEVRNWVEAEHERRKLLVPKYWPMVVPPKSWTPKLEGGYLHRKVSLVKGAQKAYLNMLATHDGIRSEPIPQLWTAINAIQAVPWRINQRVLDFMQQAKAHELDEASKLGPKLTIAEKFERYERIYFPIQLDFRGRIYPIPGNVNPITDDAGQALLEFANGKPLGEQGVGWLKVHIANLCGVGGTLANRHHWVEEHSDELLNYASNPIGNQHFWSKRKKRWRILAACFEWAGYCENGPDHICHLPVSVDGTCNGLQHLSAMVRDAKGGRATNLLPSDKPQDLYAQVAEAVKAKVSASGDPELRWWLGQKIDRELLKPSVMTTPYAVTDGTMRSQLLDVLEERGIGGDHWKECQALVPVIRRAIAEAVPAAIEVMDFLQSLGRTLWTVDKSHISWTSPAGFPVHQFEPKTETIDVKYPAPNKKGRKKLVMHRDLPDTVDTSQHRLGIVANFVHSMDASHLMSTVNLLLKEGVTDFTFVHDSYGTHPADMPTLNRCLREAFVQQYSKDVLQQLTTSVFQDQQKEYVGEEDVYKFSWGEGMPVITDTYYPTAEPPPKVQREREKVDLTEPEEQFDIREVLKSTYFFN